MARQALFLKRYDEAEGFVTQALASNPAYPRAYVVLGGVGVRRAQELSVFQSLAEGGPLDQADAAYARAVELATAADDRRMELIARLGMAGGHVTRGNLLFGLNTPEDDPEAARWLEQVVVETRPLLAPLEEIRQYRLLAQADSYLGIAAWRLAALAERQNDPGRRARTLHPGAGCAGRVRGSSQTLARGSDAGRDHRRGILHARQAGSPQSDQPVVGRSQTMRQNRIPAMLCLVLVGLLAVACGGPNGPTPSESNRVATRVAEELAVVSTLTALAPANEKPAAPTSTAVASTDTAPTTQAAEPTPPQAPTEAAAPPNATQPPITTTEPTSAPLAASCRVISAGLNLRPGPGTVYAPPLAGLARDTELRPISFVARGFPTGQWIETQGRLGRPRGLGERRIAVRGV